MTIHLHELRTAALQSKTAARGYFGEKRSVLLKLANVLSDCADEIESLRKALQPFLGDATMESILWGDMDDEALGSVSVRLKHFRAARKALQSTLSNPKPEE